jgi:hypothetical protein
VNRNIGSASGFHPLDDPARALSAEEELCKDDDVSPSPEDVCLGKSSGRSGQQLECTRSDIE